MSLGYPDEARKVRARGPVRITLPARVAYDPNALKTSIAGLMEMIGCPKCFSGADCFFQTERQFVLDGDRVQAAAEPLPWPSAGLAQKSAPQYSVGLAKDIRYDLDKVFRAVDSVIDLIGPHPCISGFDIFFQDVIRTVVIDDQFKTQVFDQQF